MTERHEHRKDDPVATLEAINYLTDREVSTVTLVHSNPDFCGPAEVVYCNGYWTDFGGIRFEGDTRLDALEKAVAAKRAFVTAQGERDEDRQSGSN